MSSSCPTPRCCAGTQSRSGVEGRLFWRCCDASPPVRCRAAGLVSWGLASPSSSTRVTSCRVLDRPQLRSDRAAKRPQGRAELRVDVRVCPREGERHGRCDVVAEHRPPGSPIDQVKKRNFAMQAKVSLIFALSLASLAAACGGSPTDGTGSTDESVTLPYKNPLRGIRGLTRERIDQGVDYAGSGPLYSIGNGTVLQVFNSGWPGGAFIAVRLSDGPAAGEVVFEAENISRKVRVGQSVTPNTVLGTLHDAFPNLEIGWGSPQSIGESYWAQLNGAYPDDCSTSFGINFSQL